MNTRSRRRESNIELQRAIFHLKRKIEFNESIKCYQVAARYRRELERLVNESNREGKG